MSAPGTPDAVIHRLNQELSAIVESPEMKKRLAEQGVDADAMSVDELKKLYADETVRWAKVIKDAKVKPQ